MGTNPAMFMVNFNLILFNYESKLIEQLVAIIDTHPPQYTNGTCVSMLCCGAVLLSSPDIQSYIGDAAVFLLTSSS